MVGFRARISKVTQRRRQKLTWDLFRGGTREMVDLALVGGASTVPEEHPLEGLVAFEVVGEPEDVVLVEELFQVQHLRRRLDDGERGGLGVVHQGRDATVGVEPEEPLLFLFVGHDVDQGRAPFGAVDVVELLQHDLRRLPVGGVLGDEVQTFGRRHLLGRVGDVEVRRRRHFVRRLVVVTSKKKKKIWFDTMCTT